jgi:Flp pilus assembly pilin Flp
VGGAIGAVENSFLVGLVLLVVIGVGARVVGWISGRWRRVVRSTDGGRRPVGHSSRRHATEVPIARSRRRRRDPHLRLTGRDR